MTLCGKKNTPFAAGAKRRGRFPALRRAEKPTGPIVGRGPCRVGRVQTRVSFAFMRADVVATNDAARFAAARGDFTDAIALRIVATGWHNRRK